MMAMDDGRLAIQSGLRGSSGRIVAALVFGALLCALLGAPPGTSPAVAQTAASVPEAGSGAPPPAEAAPVSPLDTAPAAAPPAEAADPPPGITDALLASALPRDLSPWGMFLNAVLPVKLVMVGLAFASLATWTVWLAKTLELWNAKRLARRGLEVLASATSLRAAEKELAKQPQQARSPLARFVAAAVGEADRSEGARLSGAMFVALIIARPVEAQ
jgi:biopolymer transport protein ExbB